MNKAKHARSTKSHGNSHLTHTFIGDAIRDVGHKIDDLTEKAAAGSDRLIQHGNSMAHNAHEGLNRYTDVVAHYVQENPVKSVLIAGGVGLLLAKLLKR